MCMSPPAGWTWAWTWVLSQDFWDQVKLNVFVLLIFKKNMHFVLKRQVTYLENKNIIHFILSEYLNEIRVNLGE